MGIRPPKGMKIGIWLKLDLRKLIRAKCIGADIMEAPISGTKLLAQDCVSLVVHLQQSVDIRRTIDA